MREDGLDREGFLRGLGGKREGCDGQSKNDRKRNGYTRQKEFLRERSSTVSFRRQLQRAGLHEQV
jgi:hypothetical protein